jgi:hypothetical protein
MAARHVDSAGYDIVAYNVASADDDPAVARSRGADRVVLSPAYPELAASLDASVGSRSLCVG